MSTVSTKLMTADELLQLPRGMGKVYELVNGELITMAPAGPEHGGISMDVGGFLHHFVRQYKVGKVFAAETGFIIRCNPDTVRAPDAAFVSNERLEKYGMPQRGYYPVAPDLAVEVLSPDQSQNDIDSKIDDYFEGGARLVWVVNPRRKTVMVYRSPQEVRLLTAKDSLDGEDVLPGFTCPLADIFPAD